MGIFASKSPANDVTPITTRRRTTTTLSSGGHPDQLKALPIDDDPRSPSEEIARTPIMVEASPCVVTDHRTPLSSSTQNSRKDKSLSHKMFARFKAKHRSDDPTTFNDLSTTSGSDKENSVVE